MPDVPDNVRSFLSTYIQSVEQLETLLLLRDDPQKHWTAGEINRKLSSEPASIEARIAEFHARGMIEMKHAQRDILCFYAARLADIDRDIRDAANAYSKYRVRVISLIYSKPTDKIRTFSDAFRLRKEDE